MAGLFISHSSHDDAFVRELRSALADQGYGGGVDSRQLRGGDALWSEIQQAISTATAFAVVVSTAALQSKWVGRELRHALDVQRARGREQFPVVPLALDGTRLGVLEQFSLEYACNGPAESRWFVGRVTPFPGNSPRRVVVSHQDVTQRKRTEDRVRHLNRVLHSIREVKKLAERKSEPGILTRDACELLVDRGSYDFAMIIVTDPAGIPTEWAEAGRGTSACRLHHTVQPGDLPPCCGKVSQITGPSSSLRPRESVEGAVWLARIKPVPGCAYV